MQSFGHQEPEPLVIAQHERVDSLLRQLASVAIDVMAHRIGRGEDPAVVAAEVLRLVFGGVPASAALDRPPDTDEPGPDQVLALIDDPARLDRIVAAVVEILRDSGTAP